MNRTWMHLAAVAAAAAAAAARAQVHIILVQYSRHILLLLFFYFFSNAYRWYDISPAACSAQRPIRTSPRETALENKTETKTKYVISAIEHVEKPPPPPPLPRSYVPVLCVCTYITHTYIIHI